MILVETNQPRAKIVIPDNSHQALCAARELCAYIKKISECSLPIVLESNILPSAPDNLPDKHIHIYVGLSNAVKAMNLSIPSGLSPDFSDEGYAIYITKNVVVLAGNETPPYCGTYYAVYDFLESLGCRWYFPGEFGEIVPHCSTIEVQPRNDIIRPAFRVRDVWYSGHLPCSSQQKEEFLEWKNRTRHCRPEFYLNCQNELSQWLQNPVDGSIWRLLPHEAISHPEYYAMNPDSTRNTYLDTSGNDQREKANVCMSNPDGLQAADDNVIDSFKNHPDYHAFAFSPPDGLAYCCCDGCKKAMNEYGNGFGGEGNGQVSDVYFQYVFRLAKKVSDHWIGTMAYSNRCRPPQGVEDQGDNIYIQLASIQQCSLHSYSDPNCWSRQQYAVMLRHWAELVSGHLVLYEYDPHDWTHLQRPVWRSDGIADDIRLLHKLGGWGFSNEGQMAWLSTGLNWYIRSKLAWNVDLEPRDILNDFCLRFFGPAANQMYQYYTKMEDALKDAKVHVPFPIPGGPSGCELDSKPYDLITILSQDFLDSCRKILDNAQSRAIKKPYWRRVTSFRIHFDRIEAYLKARSCMVSANYADAIIWGKKMSKCVDRLKIFFPEFDFPKFDTTLLLQDGQFLAPWGWVGALSGASIVDFARDIILWTDGYYGKLLAVFPNIAGFRADPYSEGVVQRWYRLNKCINWNSIRMDACWHNQGILTAEGRPYDGIGWYYIRINLPQVPEKVHLFFPEVKSHQNLGMVQ